MTDRLFNQYGFTKTTEIREKRLLKNHGGGGGGLSSGRLDKVVTALDITKPKAQTYAESLHDNATAGHWNNEQIEAAKAVSFPIKGLMDETRTKLKEVFWDTPKNWGKSLTAMLAKPVFLVPAWLWGKTTQIPTALTKLATSGILIANAELWKLLDAPARLMVKTNEKIQNALGAGGGGHAPAHAH